MGLPSTIAGSQLANGVKILGSGPVDFWAGPYDSAADACAVVPQAMRPFRTVIVAGVKMWWLPTDLSDNGLIPEGSGLPDQAGNEGRVLGTDGSALMWVDQEGGGGPALPAQAGNAGKVLSTDGANASWVPAPSGLPAQAGAAGKYLRTDGSAATWADVPAEVPAQTGNNGRVLSTNGTALVWVNPTQDFYTDGKAKDAAGSMLKDSTTIAATYNAGTQEAALSIKPGSITAAHLHPDLLADGNLTPTQEAALSNAANWNGKAWNGTINGVPKNTMYSDGNYIYFFRQDDFPVRSLCS